MRHHTPCKLLSFLLNLGNSELQNDILLHIVKSGLDHCFNLYGAAVAQWTALLAPGQWPVGLNPIRVSDGVRNASDHHCSCAPKITQSKYLLRKNTHLRVSHRVWRL